jgi:uroporphyrinogen decarboxylase
MAAMNSMQRVLTTLSHREPDRVPLFLLFTTHGASELGLSIQEYFSRPELVAEGQLQLRRKYRHDCLYSFFYASLEIEAWGGETVFSCDGPPNAGAPCITDLERIPRLSAPGVKDSPSLQRVLEAQRLMKERSGGEVPIIGTVMSPFSLPVMQLGFDCYLELIYDRPELFRELMRINRQFCIEWANAQLEAGATAICYFDPVSSPDITPKANYQSTGAAIASETLSCIKGPTATHLASGRCLGIIDQLAQTGTAALGVSCLEDLAVVKAACRGKLCVIGNLNGIAMRTWSPETAALQVRQAIAAAASGGGFILSDNHGEIPWQVPDEVLLAISEEVHASGSYPVAALRECR